VGEEINYSIQNPYGDKINISKYNVIRLLAFNSHTKLNSAVMASVKMFLCRMSYFLLRVPDKHVTMSHGSKFFTCAWTQRYFHGPKIVQLLVC